MDRTRVSVYIDGFNLYHSTLQHTHPDCRWLNLWELSSRLINPKHEEIAAVYYFSALTAWLPDKAKKHLLYIHALRTVGVKDILGKFNLRDRKCPLCKGRYRMPIQILYLKLVTRKLFTLPIFIMICRFYFS